MGKKESMNWVSEKEAVKALFNAYSKKSLQIYTRDEKGKKLPIRTIKIGPGISLQIGGLRFTNYLLSSSLPKAKFVRKLWRRKLGSLISSPMFFPFIRRKCFISRENCQRALFQLWKVLCLHPNLLPHRLSIKSSLEGKRII
jgi:hypothetical protein